METEKGYYLINNESGSFEAKWHALYECLYMFKCFKKCLKQNKKQFMDTT